MKTENNTHLARQIFSFGFLEGKRVWNEKGFSERGDASLQNSRNLMAASPSFQATPEMIQYYKKAYPEQLALLQSAKEQKDDYAIKLATTELQRITTEMENIGIPVEKTIEQREVIQSAQTQRAAVGNNLYRENFSAPVSPMATAGNMESTLSGYSEIQAYVNAGKPLGDSAKNYFISKGYGDALAAFDAQQNAPTFSTQTARNLRQDPIIQSVPGILNENTTEEVVNNPYSEKINFQSGIIEQQSTQPLTRIGISYNSLPVMVSREFYSDNFESEGFAGGVGEGFHGAEKALSYALQNLQMTEVSHYLYKNTNNTYYLSPEGEQNFLQMIRSQKNSWNRGAAVDTADTVFADQLSVSAIADINKDGKLSTPEEAVGLSSVKEQRFFTALQLVQQMDGFDANALQKVNQYLMNLGAGKVQREGLLTQFFKGGRRGSAEESSLQAAAGISELFRIHNLDENADVSSVLYQLGTGNALTKAQESGEQNNTQSLHVMNALQTFADANPAFQEELSKIQNSGFSLNLMAENAWSKDVKVPETIVEQKITHLGQTITDSGWQNVGDPKTMKETFFKDTPDVVIGTPQVSTSTSVDNNGKSIITTTTTTTITDKKTGEEHTVICSEQGQERTVHVLDKYGKETKVTEFKKNRPPVKLKLTAGYNDRVDMGDGVGIVRGVNVNLLNSKEAGAYLGIDKHVNIGKGMTAFGEVGVGTQNNESFSRVRAGFAYDDARFGASATVTKNFVDQFGSKDSKMADLKGRIKGENWDLVGGVSGSGKEDLQVSVGVERNVKKYQKELMNIFQSVTQEEINSYVQLNYTQKGINFPNNTAAQNAVRMQIAAGKFATASEGVVGTLHEVTANVDKQGFHLDFKWIYAAAVKVLQQGLGSGVSAESEDFIFSGKTEHWNKNLKLSELQIAGSNPPSYSLYPKGRLEKYAYASAAGTERPIQVEVFGGENHIIKNGDTFTFQEGVQPHAPYIMERNMADGTLKLSVYFGENIKNSTQGSTTVDSGNFDTKKGNLGLSTKTNDYKQEGVSLNRLDQKYKNAFDRWEKSDFTSEELQKSENLKSGFVQSIRSGKIGVSDIVKMEQNIMKEIQKGQIDSSQIPGLKDQIRNAFPANLLAVSLVRARMEIMNRKKNPSQPDLPPAQKMPDANDAFVKNLNNTFGVNILSELNPNTGRNGYNVGKNSFGGVQAIKGQHDYFPTGQGCQLNSYTVLENRTIPSQPGVNGRLVLGFLAECNNAAVFFEAYEAKTKRVAEGSRDGGIATADEWTKDAYGVDLKAMGMSIGATMAPTSVSSVTSTTYEEYTTENTTTETRTLHDKEKIVVDVIKQFVDVDTNTTTTPIIPPNDPENPPPAPYNPAPDKTHIANGTHDIYVNPPIDPAVASPQYIPDAAHVAQSGFSNQYSYSIVPDLGPSGVVAPPSSSLTGSESAPSPTALPSAADVGAGAPISAPAPMSFADSLTQNS